MPSFTPMCIQGDRVRHQTNMILSQCIADIIDMIFSPPPTALFSCRPYVLKMWPSNFERQKCLGLISSQSMQPDIYTVRDIGCGS